ncbi:MAG: anhydro-N-acetylmuramic acid kinase [Bacteroidota bacterium]|jgi:anhydro-N-acetylmuramic acid kinase|nr:anhydro-N-acetylmuramic acid kinase [Bacteroidota bacterium]
MIYKAIGLMSGSSLDGLDITFAEFQEKAGKWHFEIIQTACKDYDIEWQAKLRDAIELSARDYQILHTQYGKYLGEKVNEFIQANQLHHKVNLIASHGHTTFHLPGKNMTHQLGEGAAIAAQTKLPVVSDLRSMDIAFGGQGAPIVPMGEKLLFPDHHFFLNIGGIANISANKENEIIAFDICPANSVLNNLAAEIGLEYDNEGEIASSGKINNELLEKLNSLEFYFQPHPKSLANSFGTHLILPLVKSFNMSTNDALSTYVEHICVQIKKGLQPFFSNAEVQKLMVTGGGAFNTFLLKRLSKNLEEINFEIYVPDKEVVKFKEALIMALLGILRWREQDTTLASVTGATQNSIGGALWLGTDA